MLPVLCFQSVNTESARQKVKLHSCRITEWNFKQINAHTYTHAHEHFTSSKYNKYNIECLRPYSYFWNFRIHFVMLKAFFTSPLVWVLNFYCSIKSNSVRWYCNVTHYSQHVVSFNYAISQLPLLISTPFSTFSLLWQLVLPSVP